ncbi:right-handed parallel beta-helix repeat-containing protein [Nocardia inohanensis]|uniref:right-handed parallel beta-helix repeat-containing protein n=1 Tax=Nocardia inohanensis TaxID=209246 RepID=UPI000830041F|nr:right-handed parallel beta-helix repeat-containing protein [Nocardia inohanensis]
MSAARASAVLLVLLACAAPPAGIALAEPDPATWYVSAAAPAGGTGSAESPFDSLARAESASRDGDTIVVAAAGANVPALDGGITLKPRQRLIGDGPAVVGAAESAARPRITNTTSARDGDAVRLAPGAEVRNMVISGARRGGIYGSDAANVVIAGNEVSATNSQCSDGFMIGPFTLPASLPAGVAIPALPEFITLNNGWAAIMTDFSAAAGRVRIEGNAVHDTACGDGIDVRAHGTSRITAELSGNSVRSVNLGLIKLSVLAVGLQAADSAQLIAALSGNSQTEIAAPATSLVNKVADSEGVFINALGRADLDVTVTGNEFHGGYGNFSANGLEFVTTSGSPTSRVRVSDSTFDTVAGDVIENYNLTTGGAHQSLTLQRVHAHYSEFPGALLNSVVPANLGTCLVTTNFGRTAATDLTVADSDFGDCSADAIGLIAYTPSGAEPATAELTFDIRDTAISGAAAHGINIINVGDTARLHGTVARTAISATAGSLIRTVSSGGRIASAALDFEDITLDGVAQPCLPATHPKLEVAGIAARCG